MQTDEDVADKSSGNRVALIVEPEIMKYKYLENILASIGFDAQHAVNLPQGMDFYSKINAVDVMIIDSAVFAQTSDDDIKQIKFLRPDLSMLVIGNQPIENNIQPYAVLEEPVDYEELLRVLSHES
jgi:DNA-binding NtrC family response regulator